jgi:hypothetical protein
VSVFLRALTGKQRLSMVFWGYCVSGTPMVGILLFSALRLFPSSQRTLGNLVTGILFVSYFSWAHISLWMCAFNVARRGWGYAARGYAVVAVILYVAGVAVNLESGPPGIQRVF